MPRKRHPKKAVENALRYAEAHGWRVEVGGGHAWAGFTAPTTTMNVVAESSELQAFGVHQSIRQITVSKYGGLSITARPAKTTKSGSAT